MQSSKRMIKSKIQSFGVGSRFKILHDRIITPGDGLIIFQGMQDATAESIKSLEGLMIVDRGSADTQSAKSLVASTAADQTGEIAGAPALCQPSR